MLISLVQCAPAPRIEGGAPARIADAPKPPDEDGIGGTGATSVTPAPRDDEQGIGGTGATAALEEQGIGGTGIIGVVTGFGSVVVNGRRIGFDQSTPVSDPVGPADAADLRVGHVVAISAEERNGALFARWIARRYPVAGPIEAVELARGRVRVVGQWVAVDDATRLAPVLDGLAVGDSISVSGFRRSDGVIAATRIDERPPDAPGILTARITRVTREEIVAGGLTVSRTIPMADNPVVGDTVTLVGPIRDGRMIAARGRLRPRIPFAGRLRRLSIQGYPARWRAGGFQLRSLVVEGVDRPAAGAAPVIVDGILADGVLRARAIAVGAPRALRRDPIERGLRRPPRLSPPSGRFDRPRRLREREERYPPRPDFRRPERRQDFRRSPPRRRAPPPRDRR